jgi:hypothetical protein
MRSGGDQRARGRPYGNRPSQQQGSHQRSQTFNSNGPINGNGNGDRIRGNPLQLYQRYLTLAQDAARSEDRIAAESYYQYAEHYFRVDRAARDGNRADGYHSVGGPAEASATTDQTAAETDLAPAEPSEIEGGFQASARA